MQLQIPARSDRLHAGQLDIVERARRFNAVMCGRRYGKSVLGEQLANETALSGDPVGWFAPTFKYLDEPMRDLEAMLAPVTRDFNRQDKRLFLVTGGVIDFWSFDSDDPGRSRAYKRVIVDEAGMIANLLSVWEAAIRPTLTDYRGDAWFFGTPKGHNDFAALFNRGEKGDPDWASFRARTLDNPYMDPSEVEAARRDLPAEVFAQEYEGVPAANAGNPFDARALDDCEGGTDDAGEVSVWGVDLAKSQDWTVAAGLDTAGKVAELHRWQSDWGQTEDRLVDLLGETPSLVDETGVGSPVVERLQRRGCEVEGFKFTAQSKQELMGGLAGAVQRRELRIPAGWLMAELRSFRYEYTATGVRYAAPSGFTDDGVCALALAVKHRAAMESRPRFVFRIV